MFRHGELTISILEEFTSKFLSDNKYSDKVFEQLSEYSDCQLQRNLLLNTLYNNALFRNANITFVLSGLFYVEASIAGI